jgi:hypothetical protein
MNQNGSVDVVTNWKAEVEFPAGVRHYSLLNSTGSEAQPASYVMSTGWFLSRVKAARK